MNPDELDRHAFTEARRYCLTEENGDMRYVRAYALGIYQAKYAELWRECERLKREAEEARPKVMIVGEPI